jgi:hypothetical protein
LIGLVYNYLSDYINKGLKKSPNEIIKAIVQQRQEKKISLAKNAGAAFGSYYPKLSEEHLKLPLASLEIDIRLVPTFVIEKKQLPERESLLIYFARRYKILPVLYKLGIGYLDTFLYRNMQTPEQFEAQIAQIKEELSPQGISGRVWHVWGGYEYLHHMNYKKGTNRLYVIDDLSQGQVFERLEGGYENDPIVKAFTYFLQMAAEDKTAGDDARIAMIIKPPSKNLHNDRTKYNTKYLEVYESGIKPKVDPFRTKGQMPYKQQKTATLLMHPN